MRIARARQVYMHDVDGDVLHVYGKRVRGARRVWLGQGGGRWWKEPWGKGGALSCCGRVGGSCVVVVYHHHTIFILGWCAHQGTRALTCHTHGYFCASIPHSVLTWNVACGCRDDVVPRPPSPHPPKLPRCCDAGLLLLAAGW